LPDQGYAAAFDGLPNDPVLESVVGEAIKSSLPDGGRSLWSRWSASRGTHLLARQQKLDFTHYLPDDVLVKVDRASMAHSIEVRSPFLDYRITEWAARLPRGMMLNGTMGKLPLRSLGSQFLPAPVSRSGKRGFGVPVDQWFSHDAGKTFASERLLSRRSLDRGWWDARGVRTVLDIHSRQTGRQFGMMIWRLLMLDAWARIYVDRSVEPVRQPVRPKALLA
jgi:asparagine synthase (glutamine-hydrolysing)